MDDINILWSVSRDNAQIGALSISGLTYYIYFGPGLPKILDDKMRPMIIANIDNWLLAKTKQKYSLRNIQDMVKAYVEGVKSAYSEEDMKKVANRCVELAVKRLCRSGSLDEVNKIYWIESASAAALSKLINKLGLHFDQYKSKLGDDTLFAILCRIYRTCSIRQFDGADSAAALVSRLGRSVSDPKYPDLGNIIEDIRNDVVMAVFAEDKIANEVECVISSLG